MAPPNFEEEYDDESEEYETDFLPKESTFTTKSTFETPIAHKTSKNDNSNLKMSQINENKEELEKYNVEFANLSKNTCDLAKKDCKIKGSDGLECIIANSLLCKSD